MPPHAMPSASPPSSVNVYRLIVGPGRSRDSRSLASHTTIASNAPPPIVPNDVPSPRTIMRAPRVRGVDPDPARIERLIEEVQRRSGAVRPKLEKPNPLTQFAEDMTKTVTGVWRDGVQLTAFLGEVTAVTPLARVTKGLT